MKKAFALLALLALFACGKKGPVLAPLVRAPHKAEGIALAQRGDKINIDWKNPVHYTDGTDLVSPPTVEIWVLEQTKAAASAPKQGEKGAVSKPQPGPSSIKVAPAGKTPEGDRPAAAPAAKPTAKDFESRAKLAVTLGKDLLTGLLREKGRPEAGYSYPFPLAGKKVGGLTLFFAVRVKDARGRASEFSDPLSIEPRVVSLPPGSFEVRAVEGGVELQWQAPAANADGSSPASVAGYNVYRAMKEGPSALVNAKPVRELKYVDREAENGVPLRYAVRATATETSPYFESEESAARDIVAKDVFPPAAPTAIVPVVGRGFIALSWNANREKDLAGYMVRRREEGGTEIPLLTSKPIIENAFQDTTVGQGRRYHYLISSVDVAGNESQPTEITIDSLKDKP